IVALKNNFIVYPNNKPEIVQITTPISIVFIFISLPSYKGKTIVIIININNAQPNPVLIQLFLSYGFGTFSISIFLNLCCCFSSHFFFILFLNHPQIGYVIIKTKKLKTLIKHGIILPHLLQ